MNEITIIEVGDINYKIIVNMIAVDWMYSFTIYMLISNP